MVVTALLDTQILYEEIEDLYQAKNESIRSDLVRCHLVVNKIYAIVLSDLSTLSHNLNNNTMQYTNSGDKRKMLKIISEDYTNLNHERTKLWLNVFFLLVEWFSKLISFLKFVVSLTLIKIHS